VAAASTIDREVADIDRDNPAVPPFFAHGNQTGVGQIHRLIGVLAYEFANTAVMVTQIPGADEKTIGNRCQDWFGIAEEVGRLG
jgi:hypothetical protein